MEQIRWMYAHGNREGNSLIHLGITTVHEGFPRCNYKMDKDLTSIRQKNGHFHIITISFAWYCACRLTVTLAWSFLFIIQYKRGHREAGFIRWPSLRHLDRTEPGEWQKCVSVLRGAFLYFLDELMPFLA